MFVSRSNPNRPIEKSIFPPTQRPPPTPHTLQQKGQILYWYSVISSPCSGFFPSPSPSLVPAAVAEVASPRRPHEDQREGACTRGGGLAEEGEGEGVLLSALLLLLVVVVEGAAVVAAAEAWVERARCSCG